MLMFRVFHKMQKEIMLLQKFEKLISKREINIIIIIFSIITSICQKYKINHINTNKIIFIKISQYSKN